MINFFRRKLVLSHISLDIGLATNIGKVRKLNEDSIISVDLSKGDSSVRSCAVADGMGGYEGGEIASKSALEAFSKNLTESINVLINEGSKTVIDNAIIMRILIEAIQVANTEVYTQAQARNNKMGTTIAAMLIWDAKIYIGNVGDSRVYSFDGDNLRQITVDHSLVAELVAAGTITPDEIYTHPRRNMITRCLGTQSSIEVDTFLEDVKPGKAFLICSDGLWEMVRNNQIKDILLQSSNAQSICDQLVETANKNGGVDNISVIIVKVK